MMGYIGYGNDFGIFHFFSSVIWVLVIVFIVMLLFRGRRRGGDMFRGDDQDRALDILRERYARGEIDKEEYEEKRKNLLG